MDKDKVLITSSTSDGLIVITLGDSFILDNVIDATILDMCDVVYLDSLTRTTDTVKLVLCLKNQNTTNDIDQIRISIVEKLLENKLRYSCLSRFAEIRNQIFRAAFNPITTE